MPGNSTSVCTRCAGCTRNVWSTSWIRSPTSTVSPNRRVRGLIWRFYADLKEYRRAPTAKRRLALRLGFDRIFCLRTGLAALDRLLARLHANKAELLMACSGLRSRFITTAPKTISDATSQGEKSALAHAAFAAVIVATPSLDLAKTRAKLGLAFWDYLSSRFAIPGNPGIPPLPILVRCAKTGLRTNCPRFCRYYRYYALNAAIAVRLKCFSRHQPSSRLCQSNGTSLLPKRPEKGSFLQILERMQWN